MIGTTWKHINNMIHGVSQGFQKQLNLIGVGFRAALNQKELVLNLGHSHPIKYTLPEGITAAVNALIVISGCLLFIADIICS